MTASKLHQRDYRPEARGTLDGVRILDLSRLFAGQRAARRCWPTSAPR